MTTVAATKAAVEECTKTARATEGLSIEQKFRQLTLDEQNEMVRLGYSTAQGHSG